MKHFSPVILPTILLSPPARGAWIETYSCAQASSSPRGRPPRGGRGLKPFSAINPQKKASSPPARGAWIETHFPLPLFSCSRVAPRAGGVD